MGLWPGETQEPKLKGGKRRYNPFPSLHISLSISSFISSLLLRCWFHASYQSKASTAHARFCSTLPSTAALAAAAAAAFSPSLYSVSRSPFATSLWGIGFMYESSPIPCRHLPGVLTVTSTWLWPISREEQYFTREKSKYWKLPNGSEVGGCVKVKLCFPDWQRSLLTSQSCWNAAEVTGARTHLTR